MGRRRRARPKILANKIKPAFIKLIEDGKFVPKARNAWDKVLFGPVAASLRRMVECATATSAAVSTASPISGFSTGYAPSLPRSQIRPWFRP
jgi:hypothetical protein